MCLDSVTLNRFKYSAQNQEPEEDKKKDRSESVSGTLNVLFCYYCETFRCSLLQRCVLVLCVISQGPWNCAHCFEWELNNADCRCSSIPANRELHWLGKRSQWFMRSLRSQIKHHQTNQTNHQTNMLSNILLLLSFFCRF